MLTIIVETIVNSKIDKIEKYRLNTETIAIPMSKNKLILQYNGEFVRARLNDKELKLKRLLGRIGIAILKHKNDTTLDLTNSHLPSYKHLYVPNPIGDSFAVSITGNRFSFNDINSGLLRYVLTHGDIYNLGVTLYGNIVLHSINNYILKGDTLLKYNDEHVGEDGFITNHNAPINYEFIPPECTLELKRNDKVITVKAKAVRALDSDSNELFEWNGIIFRHNPDPSVYNPIINMYDIGCILEPIFSDITYISYIMDKRSFICLVDDKPIKSANELMSAKKITISHKGKLIQLNKSNIYK